MRKILMLSVFAGAAVLGLATAAPAQAAIHTPLAPAVSTQHEVQVEQVQYRRHYRRHYRHYRRHGRY